MIDEILRVENVTKSIDGVKRLNNINFNIFKGEILGLIPLNSHGKNELISLLTQNLPMDIGRIYIDGELVNYYEHSNMGINKVEIIDSNKRLVEDLTVADNITVLNRDFKEMIINAELINQETEELLLSFGISLGCDEFVSALNVFEKSVIELIRAVRNKATLVIVNEISSYLSTVELQKFQNLMRHCASRGTSFLYIANHHEEAFKICNRVSLMEDGSIVKVLDENEFSNERIEPYIISFDLPYNSAGTEMVGGILEFKHIRSGTLKDLSLSVEEGTCLTLLDLDNTVLDSLILLMRGDVSPEKGTVFLEGKSLLFKKGEDFTDKGIAFIQENPKENMIFKDMSYFDNLIFLLDRKIKKSYVSRRIKKSIREEYYGYLGEDIHALDLKHVRTKSLYSLAYYRIHLFCPKVVFIIQPFSNADMYLRAHIITLINMLKKRGITVVILAVSIQDSLSVSDKLITIEKGSLTREYESDDFYLFER